MQVLQPEQQLARVDARHRLVQRAEAVQQLPDAAAWHELEEDAERGVRARGAEVVDDVRVVQPAKHFNLVLQRALPKRGREGWGGAGPGVARHQHRR